MIIIFTLKIAKASVNRAVVNPNDFHFKTKMHIKSDLQNIELKNHIPLKSKGVYLTGFKRIIL